MKKNINVFIASSDDEERRHILGLLSEQNDFHITGVEKDESGTIIKAEKIKPDVLVMDLHSCGISEEELAPIIHRRSPGTAIIMLSNRDEENYARLALKAGVSGFLLRDKDTDILVPIIRIVFLGGCYVSSPIITKVFNSSTEDLPEKTPNIPSPDLYNEHKNDFNLTPAERDIIKYIAQGLTDDEIANKLHFCAGTIKNYVNSIKRKTKLNNRVQIVVHLLAYGIITFDQLILNPSWSDP